MSLKGDSLLKDVLEIETTDGLNNIKPEVIEYLRRDVLKERIRNVVITVLTVLVFVVLVVGGKF